MSLTPITRQEMYLAAAGGQDVSVPEPITRLEMYLGKLAGADVTPPDPITRVEMFLAAACGMEVEKPEPLTRLEMFLDNMSGGENDLEPITRLEEFLSEVQGGGGGTLMTYTGDLPTTITALAKAIHSLTQYGLCTQASTPTPSAPQDIYCNNGALKMVDEDLPAGYGRVLGYQCANNAMWEITGFQLQGADTVRISFSVNAACNVFGCYQGTDATDNYDLYASISSGSKYFRYAGGTYLSYFSAENLGKRFDVVYTPNGSTGMPQDSTWSPATFTSANDLLIGSTTTTGTSSKMNGNFYGDVIVEQNGAERLHLIPCMRASDSVLGYYDTVGEAFYEPYTGFDGAVSLGWDTTHLSFQTVGTPEELAVLPTVAEGYAALDYVLMNGDQKLATSVTGIGSRVEITVQNTDTSTTGRGLVTYDSNYGGMHCYVRDGEDYSLTSTTQITGVARNKNLVKILFDTGSNSYNRATLTIGSQTVTYTRNNARATKNLSFFGALSSTAEAWIGKCWGIKIYTDSTNTLVYDGVPCIRTSDGKVGFYDKVGEAFTASSGSSDFIAGIEATASVENLYSCGTILDEQNIINGQVMHNCGVYVVTGQEAWLKNTSYSGTYYTDELPANANLSQPCVGTHYTGVKGSTSISSMSNLSIKCGTSSYKTRLYIKDTNYSTADALTTYLQTQYALGTPVIVVYPLETPTTESVSPHHLHTHAGDNYITATAEVSPISVKVEYMGEFSSDLIGDEDPGEWLD